MHEAMVGMVATVPCAHAPALMRLTRKEESEV
jgi:hypothetical protein